MALYGDPNQSDRPKCWGKGYDSDSRECNRCPFQSTCRDEIVRLNIERTQTGTKVSTSDYFKQFQPVQYSVPGALKAPTPAPQQPTVVRFAPPTQQVAVQQPRPLPSQPQQNAYGYTQDPGYQYVAQMPAMFRPQIHGETFVQRLGKNVVLNMTEQLLKELLVGLRQFQWLPTKKSDHVIDVTPVK